MSGTKNTGQGGIKVRNVWEVIKDFTPEPMPGRMIAAFIKESLPRKRKGGAIITLDKKQVEDGDKVWFDHPNQMQIVAVGPDAERGEYTEKMVLKKGDLIAFRPRVSGAGFEQIVFEGHLFVIIANSDVLAVLGNDQTFKKLRNLI